VQRESVRRGLRPMECRVTEGVKRNPAPMVIVSEVMTIREGVVHVGSFDYFHTGEFCGQVKCWGMVLRQYQPGDRVTLHSRLNAEDDFDDLENAYSAEELKRLWILGRPRPEITSYQVACTDGWVLVVLDSVWRGVAEVPDEDLDVFDNSGRPYTGQRQAFLGPSLDCEACARIAAGRAERSS
jgi:hypothetical protein